MKLKDPKTQSEFDPKLKLYKENKQNPLQLISQKQKTTSIMYNKSYSQLRSMAWNHLKTNKEFIK